MALLGDNEVEDTMTKCIARNRKFGLRGRPLLTKMSISGGELWI
jgi:hypothetical protein